MRIPKKFKITPKQAAYYLHKIYKMLQKTDIKFKLDRTLTSQGLATIFPWEPPKIEIHPKIAEFVPTIIHECLHLLNWDWEEEQVFAIEAQMMKCLSDRQLMNLLKRIF